MWDKPPEPDDDENAAKLPDGDLPIAPIAPELTELALNVIKKSVVGNGVKPDAVVLQNATGGVYEIYGATYIAVHPQVAETQKKGQYTVGQVVEMQRLQNTVQTYIQRALTDQNIHRQILTQLHARADKGFGLESDAALVLEGGTQDFCSHVACQTCQGRAHIMCTNCRGEKTIYCTKCQGRGKEYCTWCSGSGRIHQPSGDQQCSHCYGTGQMNCTLCYGQARVNCTVCGARGITPCVSCGGHGWTTFITHVVLNIIPDFKILYDRLAAEVKVALAKLKPTDLIKTGDMQVSLLSDMDSRPLKAALPAAEGHILGLYYRATMPVARLQIGLGKGKIMPLLAGYHARLTDTPAFMDRLIAKGIIALQEAAKGGIDAPEKLTHALQYRVIQLALQGVTRTKPAKVSAVMLKNYPVGLSERAVKAIIAALTQTLAKLSLLPNLAGIAGSFIFCAGLVGAYLYLGGGVLLRQVFNITGVTAMAADIGVFGLIILLQYFLGRLAGQFALKHTLQKLELTHIKVSLPPAGIYNFFAVMLLVAGILALLFLV